MKFVFKALTRSAIGAAMALAIVGIACITTGPASARSLNDYTPKVHRICNDMGGDIMQYDFRALIWEAEGDRVEIVCDIGSAAVLYLGVPDLCINRDVKVHFHAPAMSKGGEMPDVPRAYFNVAFLEAVRRWPDLAREFEQMLLRENPAEVRTVRGSWFNSVGVPEC